MIISRIFSSITFRVIVCLLIVIVSGFLMEKNTLANSQSINCWPQGATLKDNSFIFADHCSGSDYSYIYKCDRNDANISNCREITQGYYNHANVLDGSWNSNYIWILDVGVARSEGHKHWCINYKTGETAPNEKCGKLPTYKSASGSNLNQGYTQYGEYYLRGYSDNNRIDVYKRGTLIETLWVGRDSEELEDVAVDGNTGIIYFTTGTRDGGRKVNLYKYTGYRLPTFMQLKNIVTFKLNGLKANQISKQTVTNGHKITAPTLTVNDAHQTFKYWSEQEGGTKYNFNEKIYEDKTLYAVYDTIYKVSFNLNGLDADAIDDQSVILNETARRPTINAHNSNQVFKHWSNKKRNGTAFNFSTPIKKDTTLYAIYEDRLDSVPDIVKDVIDTESTEDDDGDIASTIQGILNGIIYSIGIVAVIYIVVGGIQYITSTGDTSKTEKAKKTILYACIGLIACVLSFAIVNWVIISIISGS